MPSKTPTGTLGIGCNKDSGMKFTATLRMAYKDLGGQVVCGRIYGDTRGRFPDGQSIQTSRVKSINGNVVETLNSTYWVDSWLDVEKPSTKPANDNTPIDVDGEFRKRRINTLVDYFHHKSKSAGWWSDPETGGNLIGDPYVIATKLMLTVSELSEAMEGFRKDLMDDKLPHRKMAEVELADALIRICDLAGACGFDLGGAAVEKDYYNSVRADHKTENRQAVGGKAY